ncbi:nickel-dependent hydrogenase large subunit [Candidatus Woesearchaeota archaeon]|nr:nickel-dependent hydrogenase large subunit [Candidatus Woesearchaeota archaeon]
MSHKTIIDPLNRIEGDMAVEITVDEHGKVTDAKSIGFVYRGFENIFKGHKPFDAMRMSQRSCGVCPVSHGTAGAKAIENIVDFKIPRNGQLVRDIVLGANIIVSHATHFYFMWAPDLVNPEYKKQKLYPEIVKRFDPLKSEHLKAVLKNARIPLHSVVATFGGKFPHPMHAIPGGACSIPKHIELIKVDTMVKEVKAFVEEAVLNGITLEDWAKVKSVKQVLELMKDKTFAESDIGLFIQYGQAIGLHEYGEGTDNNFIAFGFGENKDGSWLFKPGYLEDGKLHKLDEDHISEDTHHSYYETEKEWRKPKDGKTAPVPRKEGAYSWVKSPRYFGNVCELGPLARQLVNEDPLITDLVKTFGVNTFTRTIARLHEICLILPKLIEWIGELDLEKPFYSPFPEITEGSGYGLAEAPRGGVGHWITVKDGKCEIYQIITPTTWNCSPKDSNGKHGAIEQALVGIKTKGKDSILEAAHIVRSFDPCISCSIHAVGAKKARIRIDPGL